MQNSQRSDVFSALAGCLCLLAASCRSEQSAPDGRRAEPAALRSAASSLALGDRPSAVATNSPVDPSPPSSSAAALAHDADCAGPPSTDAKLPQLETRRLAAEQRGRHRFELKYPLFREADEKITQKLNRQLLEELTAVQKRFVKEAEATNGAPDPDNARWFEGKCEIAYHSKSFVSVACETMEGPGAHPNLDKFAYNFRICPEVRLLALADICRSLPECRKWIIHLINEDFRAGEKKQTGIVFRDEPAGATGEPSDPEHPVARLRSFALMPTGLRIYLFDELPHVLQAFGVVDIPAAKLRPVLRENLASLIWGS